MGELIDLDAFVKNFRKVANSRGQKMFNAWNPNLGNSDTEYNYDMWNKGMKLFIHDNKDMLERAGGNIDAKKHY